MIVLSKEATGQPLDFSGLLGAAERFGSVGLFYLYIVFLVLLPGGTIRGLNVKVLIFVPVAFFAIQVLLRQKDALYQLASGSGLLAVFLLWAFIAQYYSFYNVSLTLMQYRDISATFAGCWFVRLFTVGREERKSFVLLCIYTVAFGGLLKMVIFTYALRSGVSVSTIMDGIARIFGVQFMTFELGDAGLRIQFASDTLVPVCLFAILCLRKRLRIGGITSFVVVGLLLVSSVFTFSRFLWFYAAVAAALGLMAGRRDRMHLWYFSAAVAVVAFNSKILLTIVGLRFSTRVVGSSDQARTLQKGALVSFFREAPLLGHGLGSYTWHVIRAPDLPYNYEMQVVALAGQVGAIGMLLLLAVMFNYYRKAFSFETGAWRYQGAVLLMLICFLLAGFFNPCLISSIAAGTFGLLFALASLGNCVESADEASARPTLAVT